jgi:two-component system, NarL family, sensor histidine kinase BarA
MSYRTFKRLMGETSLERKCRFLFGGGLLILITGSFYFYGQRTARLVDGQNKITGRMLVMPIILKKHWEWFEKDTDFIPVIERMAKDLQPVDLEEFKWDLLKSKTDDPQASPADQADWDALHELEQGKSEWTRTAENSEGQAEFQYYGAVRASKSCLSCHNEDRGATVAEGDLLGMAKVAFPMAPTEKALAWNNAILLATAIGTAFLAMVAAYAIVRYVIVKPVLHLKEVR